MYETERWYAGAVRFYPREIQIRGSSVFEASSTYGRIRPRLRSEGMRLNKRALE